MKIDIHSIDLVYLWVDGNNPEWLAKRSAFLDGKTHNSLTNSRTYINNDQMKNS